MSVQILSLSSSPIQQANNLLHERSSDLLQQAIVDQDETAWQLFYQQFRPVVHAWICQISRAAEDEISNTGQVEQVFERVRAIFAHHPQKFYDFPSHQARIGLLYKVTQRVITPMFLIALLLSGIQMTQPSEHISKQSVSRVTSEYARQQYAAESQIANWGAQKAINIHQTIDYPVLARKDQMAAL